MVIDCHATVDIEMIRSFQMEGMTMENNLNKKLTKAAQLVANSGIADASKLVGIEQRIVKGHNLYFDVGTCVLAIEHKETDQATDAEGNVWMTHEINVYVSIHDTIEPSRAASVAQSLIECGRLGEAVQPVIEGPTWSFIMTKEEAVVRDSENARQKNVEVCGGIVTSPDAHVFLKRQRVGETRSVQHWLAEYVTPETTWQVSTVSGKTYDVLRPNKDADYVFVTRTS